MFLLSLESTEYRWEVVPLLLRLRLYDYGYDCDQDYDCECDHDRHRDGAALPARLAAGRAPAEAEALPSAGQTRGRKPKATSAEDIVANRQRAADSPTAVASVMHARLVVDDGF